LSDRTARDSHGGVSELGDAGRAPRGNTLERRERITRAGRMDTRSMSLTRRQLLQVGAMALVQARGGAEQANTDVKALVFDTFGTVVDWRTSVAQEIETLAKRKSLTVDGPKFADAWRGGYGPSMNRVRTGELPWTKLDDLHRMILVTI